MLWIVVTSPSFFTSEASFLHRLIACGVDYIHLRKPGATADDCSRLLDQMPEEEYRHIIIHDFFELATQYSLHGIHLNARRSDVPTDYHGHISRSCHSLEEAEKYKPLCDYVFLSPIFDSISKQGYSSAFNDITLKDAAVRGIIDKKVIALGGVTPDKIEYLKSLQFGGAAMLGCVNNLAHLPENEQTDMLIRIKKEMTDKVE